MAKKILLTSFQTWLPHQVSNSSDDLLTKIQEQEFAAVLTFLRRLPVDVALASSKAIAIIQTLQPDVVICCGMAESRNLLTIESNAIWNQEQFYTSINLELLISKLFHTTISHDAGKFVCEGLYYYILKYLKQFYPQSHCLFVHVPLLSEDNLTKVLTDFQLIIREI